MEIFNRGEEDLAAAERLLVAEQARLAGTRDYSVDGFQSNMSQAIKKGAKTCERLSTVRQQ